MKRHLLYYLLVIMVALFLAPKIRHALKEDKVITTVIDSIDTSAFREGQIIMLDEVGYLRVAYPRDSSSRVLGIVTRCDSIGEITLKYFSNE